MAGPPPTKILKLYEDFVTKKLKLDENLAKVEKNIENNGKEIKNAATHFEQAENSIVTIGWKKSAR